MNDRPPPLPGKRLPTLLVGMVAANLIAAALFSFVVWVLAVYKGPHEKSFVVPSLFLVPLAGGVMAALCWRRLHLGIGGCALHSLSTTLVGLAGAAFFMGEGMVCLVMAAPAFYAMVFAGVLLGRVLFKGDDTRFQFSILPVLALLTTGEAFQRADQMEVVTDEILIHAPPVKVWPHVLAFPEIPERADYWIFRLGLPYPTKTTNSGNFVGADRQCVFSGDIVIREKVAEFAPNEKLTFDIAEQPTHPEAYGHITLHRGQFVLRDNRDGTTTLIGSSWYTLHVRPRWYFQLWADDMTRAVHLRVMRHVKHLAETSPPTASL